MKSFMNDEFSSDSMNESNTQIDESSSLNESNIQTDENGSLDENSNVVEIDNNNRRIHDEETKSILSQMNLATRSTLWELEPAEISYLYSIIKLKVDGKKVMTKKAIHRAMLREIYKKKRGDE